MKLTIFVSYSHQDARLVMPVVRLLRATEGLVFLDADSIKPCKKWQQEITKGLETAKLVVVFWCNHSGQSAEVKKEYAAAIAGGKDLLPVLLDSYPVPDDLAEFQWIDFREIVGPAHGFPGPDQRPAPQPDFPASKAPRSSSVSWGGWFFVFFISILTAGLFLTYTTGPSLSPGAIGWGMLILGLLSILLYKLIMNFTAKDIIPEGISQDGATPITHPEVFNELEAKAEEEMAEKLRDEIVQRTGFKPG